jgi:hypothetical protein
MFSVKGGAGYSNVSHTYKSQSRNKVESQFAIGGRGSDGRVILNYAHAKSKSKLVNENRNKNENKDNNDFSNSSIIVLPNLLNSNNANADENESENKTDNISKLF